MKPGIECILKSCGEPQVERALWAINSQNKPFERVTHIQGISPEYLAHNKALEGLEYEWALWVDGDTIIDSDAHKKCLRWMDKLRDKHFNEFGFGLRDVFLREDICCCALRKSDLVQRFPLKNILANDTEVARKRMKPVGWNYSRLSRQGVTIGTHMDQPSDFQVFHRFYSRGVKAGWNHNETNYRRHLIKLQKLLKETRNHQYQIGIDALNLGWDKQDCPSSHDREFERGVYDRYLTKGGKRCKVD